MFSLIFLHSYVAVFFFIFSTSIHLIVEFDSFLPNDACKSDRSRQSSRVFQRLLVLLRKNLLRYSRARVPESLRRGSYTVTTVDGLIVRPNTGMDPAAARGRDS